MLQIVNNVIFQITQCGNILLHHGNRLPVLKVSIFLTLKGGNQLPCIYNRLPHVKMHFPWTDSNLRYGNASWNLFPKVVLFTKGSMSVYKEFYIRKRIQPFLNSTLHNSNIFFKCSSFIQRFWNLTNFKYHSSGINLGCDIVK